MLSSCPPTLGEDVVSDLSCGDCQSLGLPLPSSPQGEASLGSAPAAPRPASHMLQSPMVHGPCFWAQGSKSQTDLVDKSRPNRSILRYAALNFFN